MNQTTAKSIIMVPAMMPGPMLIGSPPPPSRRRRRFLRRGGGAGSSSGGGRNRGGSVRMGAALTFSATPSRCTTSGNGTSTTLSHCRQRMRLPASASLSRYSRPHEQVTEMICIADLASVVSRSTLEEHPQRVGEEARQPRAEASAVGPVDHAVVVGEAQRQHQPRFDLIAA